MEIVTEKKIVYIDVILFSIKLTSIERYLDFDIRGGFSLFDLSCRQ